MANDLDCCGGKLSYKKPYLISLQKRGAELELFTFASFFCTTKVISQTAEAVRTV